MTDQMICSAFEVLPLPGAEERMWTKIHEKLRERVSGADFGSGTESAVLRCRCCWQRWRWRRPCW